MKMKKGLILTIFTILMMVVISGCEKKDSTGKTGIRCSISKEPEFKSTYIMAKIVGASESGFEYGDSLVLEFSNGQRFEDVPLYSGYYGKTGELAIVDYPGYKYNVFARCQGNSTWEEFEFEEGDSVTVTLFKKAKYKDIEEALNMVYSNEREDYSDDAIFSNFRVMEGGKMKKNMFYRGASPVDNQYKRADTTDELIKEADIQYVIDLADTNEKLLGYFEKEDFKSEYALNLFNSGKVCTAGLGSSYRSEEYAKKTVAALRNMLNNDGPYYIHCTEGKDRTGFVCMLLESIAGFSYDELKNDYMKTYENYYGISEKSNPAKYKSVVDVKYNDIILWLAGAEAPEQVTTEKTADGARKYLINAGMTEEEYEKLVDILCE